FLLDPEGRIQLRFAPTRAVIILRRGCLAPKPPVVIRQVVLPQIAVRFLDRADSVQPQFLNQPVLLSPVAALHSSLGLRRTGSQDLRPQLPAHPPKPRQRFLAPQPFLGGRLPQIYVLPVCV